MLSKEKVVDHFLDLLKDLADGAKKELFAQGHKATGKGIDSIEPIITRSDLDVLAGAILANDYLVKYVDPGVPANRIPYGGPPTGAKVSKYIQELIDWAKDIRPGLSNEEAKSFAFAVAATHKREGMPSNGSYSFSQNGRRTGWIFSGIEVNADQVEKSLRLVDLVATSFEEAIAMAAK